MEERKCLEHEMIKSALKIAVYNNPDLNDSQKRQAMDNIDRAAQQADWILNLLRKSGYIV